MLDKEKYIYVRVKKITVSDEVYRAYKKELNHEAHLKRLIESIRCFIWRFQYKYCRYDNTVDVENYWNQNAYRRFMLYRALTA